MNREFFGDLAKYLPSKVLPGLFGLLVIPVLTRLFNPDSYGQYILIISTISVLSILAFEWIGPSIIRYYAEYENNNQIEVFNGTIVRLLITSVLAIAVPSFFLSLFLRPLFDMAFYFNINIGILIFCFGVVFNGMMNMLSVRREVHLYSLFTIWRQCGCVLLGMAFVVIFKSSITGLLLGILVGIILAVPILFGKTFRSLNVAAFSKPLSKEMFCYGFPLIATNLSAWILSLSDRYIIGFFRGSHEVGLYSISYSLADQTIHLILSLLVLASAPHVTRIWETKGVEETKLFITGITKFYLIITIPATVGLSILSEPVITLLTTPEFRKGYIIMPLVAVSIFIYGLQRYFQLGFLLFKITKPVMYIIIASGVLNIALNLVLVPKYGFIAAGYTTLVSYTIFSLLTIITSRKYLRWKFPFATLGNTLISSAIMGIIVFYVNKAAENIIVAIGAGIVTYLLSQTMLAEIDVKEIKKAIDSLRKKQ